MASRPARLLCASLLLALGAAPVSAQADGRAAERARLAAERQRLEAVYLAEEAACGLRFAVTGCVEDVRARRRAALAPLRERELVLDDTERQERAAARRQAIAERQQTQQQSRADVRPAPDDAAPRQRAPELLFAPRKAEAVPDPRARSTAGATKAARRAEQAERRRQQVRADMARIQERLAEKAGQGRASAPLPLPAASAPRAR